MKKYKYLVCGGTFDHFHKGHKLFLLDGLSKSEHLLIGLTSDAYIKKNKSDEKIESYEKRLSNLQSFLKEQVNDEQYEIASIDSVYIPEIWDKYPIDAIFVTKDSINGARLINEKRGRENHSQLPIVMHEFTIATDGLPISSQRVRNGEITREGKPTYAWSLAKQTLFLPNNLREEVAKPFGKIVSSYIPKNEEIIISVGDVVTKYFIDKKIVPDIAVVDLKIQRKKAYTSLDVHKANNQLIFTARNKPGTIDIEVFRIIDKLFEDVGEGKKCLVHITGEEDLVALPLFLRAPLWSMVFYGQPHQGMVQVVITEEIKQKAKRILEQFTSPIR